MIQILSADRFQVPAAWMTGSLVDSFIPDLAGRHHVRVSQCCIAKVNLTSGN